MELGSLLILLLFVACPLMMVWMMRGHGSHAHGPGGMQGHDAQGEPSTRSLEELRSRRAELDAEIAELERAEADADSSAAA